MHYSIAFSRITEPELRRLILGDDEREPLTALAFVSPWVWNAIKKIARRDKKRIERVLARAVRHYVISEGYNAPNFKMNTMGEMPTANIPPKQPGLAARICGIFQTIGDWRHEQK